MPHGLSCPDSAWRLVLVVWPARCCSCGPLLPWFAGVLISLSPCMVGHKDDVLPVYDCGSRREKYSRTRVLVCKWSTSFFPFATIRIVLHS